MVNVATDILIVLVAATFVALVFLMGRLSAGRQAAWMTKDEQELTRKTLRAYEKLLAVKEKQMSLLTEIDRTTKRAAAALGKLASLTQDGLVDPIAVRKSLAELDSASDLAEAVVQQLTPPATPPADPAAPTG